MSKYQFKRLDCGPKFTTLATLESLEVAHEYAHDYFFDHDYVVVMEDYDEANAAWDYMTARGNHLYQFAVERI